MINLLAALQIVVTAGSGGGSGRTVLPVLPQADGASLLRAGYSAAARGPRACFPDDLQQLGEVLAGPAHLAEPRKQAVALRAAHSWLVTARRDERLVDVLGGVEPEWYPVLTERWSGGGATIRCLVLASTDDAQATSLAGPAEAWEIRWWAEADLSGSGRVLELARPLGDGARRLALVDELKADRPTPLWIDLGGLLEGLSSVRQGPSLHRENTVAHLTRNGGPDLLVPDRNDLAIGIEGLAAEAKTFATQLLATGALDPQGKAWPGVRSAVRLERGGQTISVLGLSAAPRTAARGGRSRAIDAAIDQLARSGPLGLRILLVQDPADVGLFLADRRFQLLLYPEGVARRADSGSVTLPPPIGPRRDQRGPAIIGIPRNRVVHLTIDSGRVTFSSPQVDESTAPARPLADQVNAVRHALYPALNRPVIPAAPHRRGEVTFSAADSTRLLSGLVLEAADADATLLPPLRAELEVPGPVSWLELRARMQIAEPLVVRRIDGKVLKSASAKVPQATLRRRGPLVAGTPLRLVTTRALATQLGPALKGQPGAWKPLHRVGAQLQTSDRPGRPLALVGPELLLERLGPSEWDAGAAGVLVNHLLAPLPRRSQLRLRIEKLELQLLATSLRAPAERRSPDDARSTALSHRAIGTAFDLRLDQPLGRTTVTLGTAGRYKRDHFPADGAVQAVDREATDDWRGSLELGASTGLLRPVAGISWDTEFSAGDPGSEATPPPRQHTLELNGGVLWPKAGRRHEARLSFAARQDLSRVLAATDPTPELALPDWRFGVDGRGDWRQKLGPLKARLMIGATYFLPATDPAPSTLWWSLFERLELAVPMAGGLHAGLYAEHFAWRTYAEGANAPDVADTALSAGFTLSFARVMRPFAGVF
jgi:hypothetical protein